MCWPMARIMASTLAALCAPAREVGGDYYDYLPLGEERFGLLIADGNNFFSEEKRNCKFEVGPVEPGVPAFRLVNTELGQRYRIEKEIFADPHRNVVLQKIRFVDLGPTAQPGAAVPRRLRESSRARAPAPHLLSS